ncbi:DUF4440 domain-containing protein [Geomicrobium sp. JCM 19039]|uniref:nuclear transport factor 2 family protein n=1 Tax=Geomicrobium sp. JCM 19039 TaxID=1460636 RepID=UPI00045F2D27|nr:DUF4440 domain-containing protein [Geomicrobium sp. JCM 19039]GAK10785.1 hypothetical protein JCM19039_425 [Geomicrobium sp. JCM 19039]
MGELKAHIQQLEESHLSYEIRSSPEQLRGLLSKDFFEFGSSGKVFYTEDVIQPGVFEEVDLTMHDFSIHRLSTQSVLTTYRVFNSQTKRESLRSSVWTFEEGRWQLYFHQGTNIPKAYE